MDLRQFYRKVRELEHSLAEPYVMVRSIDTSDGGRAGILSEVVREVAAMLIIGGKAELASGAEIEAYQVCQEEAKAAHEKAEMAKRVQVAIISDTEGRFATPKPANK
jgi:hypothetical protein